MIVLTSVIDTGNDVLEVKGYDDSDQSTVLTAYGWLSAMSNYYPPASYETDADGNLGLVAQTTPRKMTSDEQQAYWLSLLQAVSTVPQAQASTVLFSDQVQ